MGSKNCKFRQRDVVRAAKAAMTAGLEVSRIEVDSNGNFSIVTTKDQAKVPPAMEPNEWDSLIGTHTMLVPAK